MTDRMPEDMPNRMPDRMPKRMPEDLPDRMSDGMNAMVGITRSKVIVFFPFFWSMLQLGYAQFISSSWGACSLCNFDDGSAGTEGADVAFPLCAVGRAWSVCKSKF